MLEFKTWYLVDVKWLTYCVTLVQDFQQMLCPVPCKGYLRDLWLLVVLGTLNSCLDILPDFFVSFVSLEYENLVGFKWLKQYDYLEFVSPNQQNFDVAYEKCNELIQGTYHFCHRYIFFKLWFFCSNLCFLSFPSILGNLWEWEVRVFGWGALNQVMCITKEVKKYMS